MNTTSRATVTVHTLSGTIETVPAAAFEPEAPQAAPWTGPDMFGHDYRADASRPWGRARGACPWAYLPRSGEVRALYPNGAVWQGRGADLPEVAPDLPAPPPAGPVYR